MLRTLVLLAAAGVVVVAGPAAADVYKFKDDKGNVLYTDKPSTLPAERLNIQSNKTDVVAAQTRQQEEMKRMQDAAKANQPAPAAAAANPQQAPQLSASDKADQCTKSRERYEKYSTSQRLYEMLPDGSRRYLSDAEIDAARASSKASMDVMCK
ncbi:MAG TPA: DUF4124 domain-containing protein [Steroidobacteraceae bacterium]|nr:DUF4124 domain-containing protein [Steroidobacteraceae bacterium]